MDVDSRGSIEQNHSGATPQRTCNQWNSYVRLWVNCDGSFDRLWTKVRHTLNKTKKNINKENNLRSAKLCKHTPNVFQFIPEQLLAHSLCWIHANWGGVSVCVCLCVCVWLDVLRLQVWTCPPAKDKESWYQVIAGTLSEAGKIIMVVFGSTPSSLIVVLTLIPFYTMPPQSDKEMLKHSPSVCVCVSPSLSVSCSLSLTHTHTHTNTHTDRYECLSAFDLISVLVSFINCFACAHSPSCASYSSSISHQWK